jgi:hypothetical protein
MSGSQHGQPHVVILTGGALPGHPDQAPAPNEVELALERAGVAQTLPPLALARAVISEAYKLGWHQAAQHYRVVAVYVLADEFEANRFAVFMTAEVDPAHVMRASAPLPELLAAWENNAGRVIR